MNPMVPTPPDDGWRPTTPPAADNSGLPGWADGLLNIANHIPDTVWTVLAATIGTVAVAVIIPRLIRTVRGRPAITKKTPEQRLRILFVLTAALIGSTFTLMSMYDVLGHKFDSQPARIVLCGIFEVAALACALNSRAFRIERARREAEAAKKREEAAEETPGGPQPALRRDYDIDGLAVWVIITVGAFTLVLDANDPVVMVLSAFVPYSAGFLWERLIARDLRHFTREVKDRGAFTIIRERVKVALGLAEPSDMTMGDRAQARLLNRLARARFKVHALEAGGANRLSLGWARWRLRRLFLTAVNQLDLAGRPDLRHSLQERIAVLMAAETGTSPEAVEHLQPWAPQPNPTPNRPNRESESPRIIDSTATPAHAESAESRLSEPTRPAGQVARRFTASRRPESTAPTSEPARIGGDESEMVTAIRPFVAQFRARNGKAPGQQVTRNELARFGYRVGTRRAGELADLADSANLSDDAGSVGESPRSGGEPATPGSESADPATDSDSAEPDSATDSASTQRSA